MISPNSTAGESCGWREYVDLEHTICYNNSNHWNALTDGRVKYIFNAMDASEQLFNLTADPGELNDLSALPQFLVWNLAHLASRHLTAHKMMVVRFGAVARPHGGSV